MKEPIQTAAELSIGKLSNERLVEDLAAAKVRVAEILVRFEAVAAERDRAMKLESALLEEQTKRRIASSTNGPDWQFLLDASVPTSTIKHKALKSALSGLVDDEKYGFLAIQSGGEFLNTRQTALRVALIKGMPELTAKVHARLKNDLLPFVLMQPASASRNQPKFDHKHIGVFEHSLSEYGSYFLAINEDLGKYELRVSRGSNPIQFEGKSLAELLTYVERNRFYEAAA